MIKTYSQRNLNPYSGQVQIAESDNARAVSMDGENWELHFLRTIEAATVVEAAAQTDLWSRFKGFFGKEIEVTPSTEGSVARRAFTRFGTLDRATIEQFVSRYNEASKLGLVDLAEFLLTASLPFPAIDKYEYWLLDSADNSPLALLYSCSSVEEQSNFPAYPAWTALPAAIMPVDRNEHERQSGKPPVNSRLESLVAERAGTRPKAAWFERSEGEADVFPPFLVKEDWPDDAQIELCQRYLNRQAPRLLMLHGLSRADRARLEQAARVQALEVGKYYSLYPGVSDENLMKTIRVEARLRETMGETTHNVKYRWS